MDARWIWDGSALAGDGNPWNYYLSARRAFDLPAGADFSSARLHVTADTRYVLWVNGQRIGYGPVRSWPWAWRYDTYDLSKRLRPGRNTIAILGIHYGVGTFQSLPTRAGILAQLQLGGQPLVLTDESWKVRINTAYRSHGLTASAPRISCQQGWVEIFTALEEPPHAWIDESDPRHAGRPYEAEGPPPLWYEPGFDDSGWQPATVLGPAGMEPWGDLLPRDVPFLTEEPVYPSSVLESRRVRLPGRTISISLRRNLLPGYSEANPQPICGLLAMAPVNRCDHPVPCIIRSPGPGHNAAHTLRVNGAEIAREPATSPPWSTGWTWTFDLQSGPNLLMWDVTGFYHEWAASMVMDTQEPVAEFRFIADTFGPFESTDEPGFQDLGSARSVDDLAPFAHRRKPVEYVDRPRNPFPQAAYAEPLDGAPRVENVEALCGANPDSAMVYPDSEGADIELLIDLGQMTVGWWEFEIEAQAGTRILLAGIESIQDGHRDMPWGVNNALWYQAREGWQTFRSIVRRGARYLLLTIPYCRQERPVRIRSVRVIQSTHPVVERGRFECSDPLLNEIWRMGAYTTRLCMEDTYVDCPTYEQTYWVGDARIAAAVNHMAYGEYALTRRSLLLAAQSMERSPIVESQVPSSWQSVIITWSLLWVMACEEYWQHTADLSFVEEIYPYLARQMGTLAIGPPNPPIAGGTIGYSAAQREAVIASEAKQSPPDSASTNGDCFVVPPRNDSSPSTCSPRYRGVGGASDSPTPALIRYPAYHMIDWAAVDNPPDAAVTHTNAFYVESLRRMAILARGLGEEEDAAWAESLAAGLVDAINQQLWDEERQAYRDCIHADGTPSEVFSEQTQIAVLLCRCATPERDARTRRYIGDPPKGFVRVGSPFTLFFALEALGDRGEHGRILDIIRQRWGMMLERGATTCWETFPGWEANGRWTRSHCHAWSAGPTYFLSRYQLGVGPLEPGFRRVLIAPQPASLTCARGRIPTPHGEVEVDWRIEDGCFRLNYSLPEGVTAEICLPESDGTWNQAVVNGLPHPMHGRNG